jgi:hypothetical protein
MSRAVIIAMGIAIAAVFFVVLRPDDDDGSSSSPPPPPPATTAATTTATEPPPPPPPPPPAVARVPIVVRGGAPVGGIRRVTVAKDRQVVLVVRSDAADHVHLHGYDIMRDVAPGSPAQLAFKATIPGRFEVELEDAGLQIADITVKP